MDKQLKFTAMKTTAAVTISAAAMHFLFSQNPFYACIGATVGVGSTKKRSLDSIIIKNIGMFIGGIIGMAVAFLTDSILLKGLGVLPVILVINLAAKKESTVSGCIMYYGMVFLNTFDTAGTYAFNSITQTLFGSLVGMSMNFIFGEKDEDEEYEEESEEE